MFLLQDSCWLDLCHSSNPIFLCLHPPHLPISLPFSPCLAFFFFSCIPIYLSGSLPLGLRCSDGRAFSIIYCAFKSLTSCAVCKRPWFCVRITADTVDKSAVVCNMRQEGFPKMARGSFLFFLFLFPGNILRRDK